MMRLLSLTLLSSQPFRAFFRSLLDKKVQEINALASKAEEQINQKLQGVNNRLNKVEATQLSQNPTTILDVQKTLKDLGYYTGALNGIFDHDTQLAIVAYQKKQSLAPDGLPGFQTLSHLGISTAGGVPRLY
jgi:peptidoglycan hydrolase-like protein with peptidoglycan-binding domain